MKTSKFRICLLAALMATPAVATPDDLFFSEYIEGSSNNKALEIANLTETAIDLTGYQVQMYFNGNTSAGLTIDLNGSVEAGDVFVLAQSQATTEILNQADQTQGSGWFNGDDAIVLLRAGIVIDSIGQVGFDPGSQWGSGLASTQNNTLRRDLGISQADNDAGNLFEPSDEWTGFDTDTFDGLGQLEDSTPPIELTCGAPATRIHSIQGRGTGTPLSGQALQIEGIVVGDFQQNEQLRGFFVQEEDSDQDSDVTTSEALFVFDNLYDLDVNLGDKVRVAGTAGEFGGMTQLGSVSAITLCESGLSVTPVNFNLPLSDAGYPESIEGMLIEVSQALTVSENFNLGRFGEVVLSNGRLFNPTNQVLPGADAVAMQAVNDLNRIILDDGSTRQNPSLVPFPAPGLSALNSLRAGDQVTYLSGVMHQAFGDYRLQVNEAPVIEQTNARPQTLLGAQSELTIASFNVLNYFNGDGFGGGFPTSRGADNQQEFERQRDKIVSAIVQMEADVIGLMEIENDGFDETSAIADLVNSVNQATGKIYQFVAIEGNSVGTDEIAVGIIFDSEKVTLVGDAATINTGAFADRNRQPLIQKFREIASNGEFTLVVNHFKSKGSCPGDAEDPNADQGDGQGCWNALRTQASEALTSWLQVHNNGDDDIMIIGDINAYTMEDPVRTIEQAGYRNLLKDVYPEGPYSFVFFGQAGALDHALASDSLAQQVTGTELWHINADEPRVIDYNLEFKSQLQQQSYYNADPYRASDHDPVLVGLYLRPEADINMDGKINRQDLVKAIRKIFRLRRQYDRRFDFNTDGRLDFRDIQVLIHLIYRR